MDRSRLIRKFYIKDFYEFIDNKIQLYKACHPEKTKLSALKLGIWCLLALVQPLNNKRVEQEDNGSEPDTKWNPDECMDLCETNINIGFIIGGGLGDKLIFANYLYCLKKKYKDAKICADIYFPEGFGVADSIFENDSFTCHRIYKFESGDCAQLYDWFVWVNRYPMEQKTPNFEKINKICPKFGEYIRAVQRFATENKTIFDVSPRMDGYTSYIESALDHKRIQQPDIYNLIGIKPDFEYPLFVKEDADQYLRNVGLKNKKFITIHRGSDVTYSKNVVKLWPLEYYNELIKMLKEAYPDYIIVQMGVSRDRCPAMEGADVDLVGKTSMEQVKLLLRESSLHIDSEGGYVHIRRALRAGRSVVLFGSTSLPFFGYDYNINIVGDGCNYPCEWMKDDWIEKCVRGYEKPPCMYSIKPTRVMNEILKINFE